MEAQQARTEHRQWIGGRIATLLNHYWRDDDPTPMTAALGADWADVLEGIPRQYIQGACLRYQRKEARRKPTPGAIYQMARDAMPRPQLVRADSAVPEPDRVRCDPDIAQALCEAAGYTPKRFGGNEE